MELRQGILGIIDASLNYFDSNSSSLSESAKNHIGKKSQDAKSELEEKKKLLQSLETQLANLEEERIRIENESDRIRLKKTEAVYYNNIHTNQLFNLQKKIFELETEINIVASQTPREPAGDLSVEEITYENYTGTVSKSLGIKNLRNRREIGKKELDKALIEIKKLEEEVETKNKEIDKLNSNLSSIILEKKQLLIQNKKIFDEKFKKSSQSSKFLRKSMIYNN